MAERGVPRLGRGDGGRRTDQQHAAGDGLHIRLRIDGQHLLERGQKLLLEVLVGVFALVFLGGLLTQHCALHFQSHLVRFRPWLVGCAGFAPHSWEMILACLGFFVEPHKPGSGSGSGSRFKVRCGGIWAEYQGWYFGGGTPTTRGVSVWPRKGSYHQWSLGYTLASWFGSGV